ncbi:MAG: AzlD domain-containing protein [Lachnospiraceae bacterium]|nr:AzlD domain-containing protein [Lachnospiraceae bacterium]
MRTHSLYIYIIVMAAVTYAIRALPLTLIRSEIKNRFIRSFLYYVPYATLAAMTFPAILSSTDQGISAAAGFAAALLLAFRRQSLIVVACGASATVLIVELAMGFFA